MGVRPSQPKFSRTQWGTDPQQVVDHYAATGTSKGHLVLVHGGGWTTGTTQHGIIPFYAPLAQSAGFDVTSVGYRLAGPYVDWHVQVQDILAGIAYVRTSLGVSGPLLMMGESAGGHLAAMVALGGACIVPVAGLISLYGVLDLQAIDADCPAHTWSTDENAMLALRYCLGGYLPWEDWYVSAYASPVYLAQVTTAEVPRVLLVHSTDDPLIGAEQSRRLQRVLAGRPGVSVSLLELPWSDHGGVKFQAPPVSNLVMSFLAAAVL
jgi:acetyl esterase/lipase